MAQSLKACPRCGAAQPLQAEVCPQCGHQFRTQFQALPGTQLVGNPQTPGYQPLPYAAQPYPQPLKERSTAMLLEILLGFFGLPGFGWIYAGRTTTGLILLLGLVAWDTLIMCPVTVLTAGFGICCVLPINWTVMILSAISLNSHTKQHPELFRP